MNASHTVDKVLPHTPVKSTSSAFLSELSTGLKAPSERGERVVAILAGSETHIVPCCLNVFCKRKKGDYYDEMDSNELEEWFCHLLNHVEPNSVIVIDNVPYLNRKSECVPTTARKISDYQHCLSSKNVP